MSQPFFDVVVVGAGPAGSFAAENLAALGWGVALVDENDGPRRDIVCSGIVGAEAFRRYDLPNEAVVDVIGRGCFVSPSGLQVVYAPPDPPLAYVVDRTHFDRALTDRACEVGAELYHGYAGRRVWRTPDGVHVGAESRDGETEFHARALVVATGHQRWLHEAAGLGVPSAYVHGVHCDQGFAGLDAAELYFGRRIAPGYFAWTVPYGEGRARLGALAPQGARRGFRAFLERETITARLVSSPPSADGGRPGGCIKSRGIVQGPVLPSYADRVLAVGEAAGQVKTTTAGGIYYGLIGAELASRILDEGLRRNRLDAAFLARYEDRWWGRLGGEIESGLKLQRLGRGLDDYEIDELFGALANGLGTAVRRLVRFDWHRPVLRELFQQDLVRRLARRSAAVAIGQA